MIVTIIIIVISYFFYKKGKKIKSILFIGDSNTVANYSYADQLKTKHPNLIIKKIAKVGEKTDWMLLELQKELQLNNYDLVCILGGSNDIYALNSNLSAKQNLIKMYDLIKSKDTKIVAITPPNKNFYVNKTAQKQYLLNDLVQFIKSNKTPDYIFDFYEITNNKTFFSATDGFLHANAVAHQILSENISKKINLI